MKENKESLQVGWTSKVSVACKTWGSCKQTRPNFSSRRHRISTRLHMQQHIKLLSSLIILFYIFTANFLCYIFSKGHATAHHGGRGPYSRYFCKMRVFLRVFDFTTVFQHGRQRSFTRFGLVSILFLFQILIFYIN